jgi:hypothetical protein
MSSCRSLGRSAGRDRRRPLFLTVAEAASLIAAKQLSPVELTRAYLDRIERLNGTLHAYVRVLHDQALTAARMATEEISAGHYRGPLHGVPSGSRTSTIPPACRPRAGRNYASVAFLPAMRRRRPY